MKLSEAKKGLEVKYIPTHAWGDEDHPHCETGIISSWNDKYIFVRYFRNGMSQHTPESTQPEDLVILQ